MSETVAAPANKSRRWLRLLPLAVIAAMFVAVVASGALKHVSLNELAVHRAQLTQLVAQHPVLTLVVYVLGFSLFVLACLPGPSLWAATGGFLFGPWVGGAAALAGGSVGSTLVFLACRTAFGDWLATRAGSTAARIEAGFARNAFSYLLALRLAPVAPMFLVNIAAGMARIPLPAFVLATVIGTIPGAFIFASLGAGLDDAIRRHAALDAGLFTRPGIVLPLAGLTLISLIPTGWRAWKARRR